uniref:ABC transporter n=1 Tax=Candidatus Kentrum sp. TUN TaxID=2126343 RepID=A0A450ZHH6_9GAMM|nr:MAG: hypothetical protein BECKTUN1418F_GA0071002_101214 [Candidatus Kentron sp. TUN]VFK53255.1 MAG: hypothetical protein BECKTUN1418E_GA0071001_101414 [Candidatus Kentron sp. TUN]
MLGPLEVTVDSLPSIIRGKVSLEQILKLEARLDNGLHGLTVEEAVVRSWLERLELVGKIAFSKNGFSRFALSTGERKRLAFLVARLYNREIFLFDELTADQDPHYRRYF